MAREAELPDGTILEFPDGTPDAVIDKTVKSHLAGGVSKPNPAKDFGGLPFRPFGIDTGLTMPQWLSNGFAGGGKAIVDTLGRGPGQLLGLVSRGDVDASRKRDEPLMNTTAGAVGNFVGNAAPAVATAAIPGANTYTGAATIGALLNAAQPVGTNDSRLSNAAIGGAAGVVGQGIGNAIGRAFRPVQTNLTPEQQSLLSVLDAAGVPTNVAQRTGSKALANVNAAFENLPFTAGKMQAANQAQKEAFNAAIGRQLGIPNATALTDEVLAANKGRMGQGFSDLASRNALQAEKQGLDALLAPIEAKATRFDTSDNARVIKNYIDEIVGKVEANGQIPGEAYRKFDSAISSRIRGLGNNGDLRNGLQAVRDTVREAMDNSIGAADQAAWKELRTQYAKQMTVAPNAARSPTGDVSPATLLTQAKVPGDLRDLAKAGKAFLPSRVGDSGTAQRSMYMRAMSDGLLGLGGAGAGYYATDDPVKGLALGGAALASPSLFYAALNNPATRAYLLRGLPGAGTAVEESARLLGRAAPLGLLPYATQK